MLRVTSLLLLSIVVGAGCIEGDDPGSCKLDVDCGGGQVCTAMKHCAPENEVREIKVLWTINGSVPSPTSPGPCDGVSTAAAGAGNGTSGFVEQEACSVGFVQLSRVPWDFTTVGAFVYRGIGNGNLAVVDQKEIELPNADAEHTLTIDLVVP